MVARCSGRLWLRKDLKKGSSTQCSRWRVKIGRLAELTLVSEGWSIIFLFHLSPPPTDYTPKTQPTLACNLCGDHGEKNCTVLQSVRIQCGPRHLMQSVGGGDRWIMKIMDHPSLTKVSSANIPILSFLNIFCKFLSFPSHLLQYLNIDIFLYHIQFTINYDSKHISGFQRQWQSPLLTHWRYCSLALSQWYSDVAYSWTFLWFTELKQEKLPDITASSINGTSLMFWSHQLNYSDIDVWLIRWKICYVHAMFMFRYCFEKVRHLKLN